MEFRYILSDDFPGNTHGSYDLVVEGCPTFQSTEKIRADYSTDPGFSFLVKLSAATATALGVFMIDLRRCDWIHPRPCQLQPCESPGYSHGHLYACTYISQNIQKFSSRNISGFWSRPHTLAWLSSNCVPFRLLMWDAFYSRFTAANLSGIHSLGACSHNRDIIDDAGWWSSDRIYSTTNCFDIRKYV